MRREEVLRRLAESRPRLADFHVKSLSVFGSVARDEAGPGSDVDLLVEFNRPVGLFHMARLQRYLEEVLGCPVDLATPDALREHIRDRVLKEAIRAA